MASDYYLVKRRHLVTKELFRKDGIYAGLAGWNLHAAIAMVVALLPNLPGFLHSVGVVSAVPSVFDSLFNGAWFIGFFIGATVYWVLASGRFRRIAYA